MRPDGKLVIILLWLTASSPLSGGTAGREITVGVLAHRGADTTMEMWTPTIEYLAEQISGHEFRLLPLDLHGMRAALEHNELDLILTNPGNYVELEAGYGITRIATLKNQNHGRPSKTFGAVILTRTGRDDIRVLADLRGKTFAAVAEDAFGGFQMAWRELVDAGIDPFNDFSTLHFVGFPQDNIVFDVRDGKMDAGTVRTGILEGLAEQGIINLADFRILNRQVDNEFPFLRSTRLYPEWAFAKGRSMPDALASKVAIALLQMPDDHPASRAGNYAGWTVPLSYQPVHDLFRQLKTGPYAKTTRITLLDVIRHYWHWFALMLLLILFSMFFNIFVKRQVNRRTAELTKEVAERKRAEEESRKLLSENRFLIQKSLAVQEGERRHLARELHDELGQCITAIQADAKIISQCAPDCEPHVLTSANAIQEVASRIYEVVHSMMQRLRPGMLDDLGLVDTLKEEIDAWRDRHPDTLCQLTISGDPSNLGDEANITLYRITQECLTNIAKYARAQHVTIELGIIENQPESVTGSMDKAWIRMVIQDDGTGMDMKSHGSGLGLIGMRERVEGLYGRFSVVSEIGKGTTISVYLPLTPAEPATS
ncbi:MAG: PhnD/SsuA/transferrin family substrate-binding protein [Gammaproteobacteria bacterium]|nr:PhnD/SsuA/transferrin family substrate-binding protein [Gammaproteobacteria bacterium]